VPSYDCSSMPARRLYRFGLTWESRADLARQAGAADASGYPYGISAFAVSSRADAASVSRSAVERHFRVVQTGRNQLHHTVVLPKPVTEDVARLVNQLFGRRRP
jgi:hypothetical protein